MKIESEYKEDEIKWKGEIEDKAIKSIIVGYHSGDTYQLCHPATNWIILSCDVTWTDSKVNNPTKTKIILSSMILKRKYQVLMSYWFKKSVLEIDKKKINYIVAEKYVQIDEKVTEKNVITKLTKLKREWRKLDTLR